MTGRPSHRRRVVSRRASAGLALLSAVAALPLAACGSSKPSDAPAAGAGTTIASSGFEAGRDGFSFKNYGWQANPINLTPQTMQTLYGPSACARSTAAGCTLTAPAAAWMALANSSMGGGHCFGMAALAAVIFNKQLQSESLGAPTTFALQDDGTVQSMIARLFITQKTDPTVSDARKVSVTQLVTLLKAAWAKHQTYILSIHSPDGKRGHAVTPIALRDAGSGLLDLAIYDNNHPDTTQTIRLDPKADTWSYDTPGSTPGSPDAYGGGAANPLKLTTPADTLKTQSCPFCRTPDDASTYVVLDDVSAKAGVTVTVTDTDGRTIPGAVTAPWETGEDRSALVLRVPAVAAYRVTLKGAQAPAGEQVLSEVTVIGHGWSDSVADIKLGSGEEDTITVTPATGAFSYTSKDGESPALATTVDEGDVSYQLAFQGADIDSDGGTYDVSIDQAGHTARITSVGTGNSEMAVEMTRIDTTSDQTFANNALTMDDGQTLVADYGSWRGDGTSLSVGVADSANGPIVRTVTLTDQQS